MLEMVDPAQGETSQTQIDLPVLSRDPNDLPKELPRGSQLPEEHDPLADGILMQHQLEWLEDKSDLKLGEKGRRCGLTYAEALDDTITAATDRKGGGDNVFYIGDTKDKGREFIGYVSHFAKIIQGELAEIEEFLFEDEQKDGTSKFISAFRIRFSSGFRVEALSSNPSNIRGLQGIVVIDEAAFHKDVREVLDAVNALLIWGGKVRVISTHNGVLNPFNELIREAKARKAEGKKTWSLHFIPFSKSVENGLFKRVCLIRGREYTKEAEEEWEAEIRAAYGSRTAKMRQELDAIPAESEGAALTRTQIEACMSKDLPVVRWQKPDSFKDEPDIVRKAAALLFCKTKLLPILKSLDPNRQHALGEDFARTGDLTCFKILEIGPDLIRRAVLSVELRNMPFDQQRDILFFICDRLPKFMGGALDARGNGQYLAEKARQRYGEIITEVMLTAAWYRENAPQYIEAFVDRDILIAQDEDILRDHQGLQYVGDIIKVPDDHKTIGADGGGRHGDSAIAGMLAWYASLQNVLVYSGYAAKEEDLDEGSMPEDEREGNGLW